MGASERLNILASSRQQWVGMPGAPKTFLVGADMPLRFLKQDHGVGLMLSSESIGLFSTMTMGLQYAFKVKLWGGKLGLGLQLGLLNQKFDGTKVYIPSSDEHVTTEDGIPQTQLQGMAFDMGFGAYYTHKYFYVGLSSQHLTQPLISFDEKYETYASRTYFFMGGGNIPIKNTLLEVQPSMMLKTTFKMTQAELTARLKYNNFIWGGLGYRWKDAMIVMIGAKIKNVLFGYAYDYPVSKIVKATKGSHEVFVSYSMKVDFSDKNKNKHKSIRIL